MARITYRDFIRLFKLTPGTDDEPAPWLSVREDGVYVKRPPDGHGLNYAEWQAITESMSGDFNVPEIRFPCSLNQFEKFVDFHRLRGTYDEAELPADEPKAERGGKKALNASQESEIVKRYSRGHGESVRKLAAEFGVSRPTIDNALKAAKVKG